MLLRLVLLAALTCGAGTGLGLAIAAIAQALP
jgi:hypothetical protein